MALLLVPACSESGTKSATAPPTSAQPATTLAPSTAAPSTAPPTTLAIPALPKGEAPLTNEVGDLRPGVKGLRTLRLQAKLESLRFDVGVPDGAFGGMTVAAVWAWQAAHGFPRTGVVPADQEAQLLASSAVGPLHPELGLDHVEVDLDRQILLEFKGGRLDLITHVSTGTQHAYCEHDKRNGQLNCGDAITPTGSFAFGRRAAGWEIGPLGGLYNPVYFHGGIAVHGEPYVPNYPASHGCVRIPMHISTYFPDRVVTGEPVIVYRGGSGPLPAGLAVSGPALGLNGAPATPAEPSPTTNTTTHAVPTTVPKPVTIPPPIVPPTTVPVVVNFDRVSFLPSSGR